MPTITFPLEIKENILDLLAEDDKGHLALRTCSLVCRAFLPNCRKHIFESIVLNHHDNNHYVISPPTSPSHAFERLLRETPEIADYIRKLDYNILTADLTSSSIQESLKRISRLEFLSVQHHNWSGNSGLNWRNNPIRPTLLHLLHLPTLTHFKMTGMNDFIVSDLIPCVNLEYLDIGVYTTVAAETTILYALPIFPENSIQLHEFVASNPTSTTIMKFCSARRPDGQSIIDFGSLSKITVILDDPNEALQELFRRCHALTNARIYFSDPWNVRPSLSDMLRPSMQTLRHIVVGICVGDGDDSLLGIPSEFEDMRTKNIIETIAIKILVRMHASYCLVGEDWDRLDEILTSPGWLSLKRVSLALKVHRYYNGLSEAFRKLPETQFPRLSSSKSISLDIKVKTLSTETD